VKKLISRSRGGIRDVVIDTIISSFYPNFITKRNIGGDTDIIKELGFTIFEKVELIFTLEKIFGSLRSLFSSFIQNTPSLTIDKIVDLILLDLNNIGNE